MDAETRRLAEDTARDQILEAYAGLCPGIVGNPYLNGHFPLPMQFMFLRGHEDEPPEDEGAWQALYGGAAGGGKSDALLMAAAQYVDQPEFAAIVFRRTFADLSLPNAIMDRALTWWKNAPGVHWDGTNKTFRFRSGAKVSFAYCQHAGDEERYQGAEFHLACWDELTHFPNSKPYRYLLSRVRRAKSSTIPLRSLAASNPGGAGGEWVGNYFDVDPENPGGFPFFPARIVDNPYLDRDAYIASLQHLHPTIRRQLLDGDWRARDPGDYFRREWFGPLLDPETDTWPSRDCVRVRWWDLAASEAEDAAHTAGVRMARHRSGVYAVEHCVSFKATPGKRDARIVDVARADGPTVTVGLEVEPGSGGIAQVESIAEKLAQHGIRCVYARPRSEQSVSEKVYVVRASSQNSKAARCDPVAACLERGYARRGEGDEWDSITQDRVPWWGLDAGKPVTEQKDGIRLFAGPWTQAYLDIVEGFPGDGDQRVDEADATSGAWSWLKTNPIGATVPNEGPRKKAVSYDELLRTNPSERPEAALDPGRDRAGRYRP